MFKWHNLKEEEPPINKPIIIYCEDGSYYVTCYKALKLTEYHDWPDGLKVRYLYQYFTDGDKKFALDDVVAWHKLPRYEE